MGETERIIELLHKLRKDTTTDFVALACQEYGGQTIRWKYASGNRNERYKKIIPSSKGIVGSVIRSGRSMIIPSFSPKSGDDPSEYPILLAEGLKSVVVVPISGKDKVQGVLLVGCREVRAFTNELEQIFWAAEQLRTPLVGSFQ